MTFTIYGIRIKGEREARYIGQTGAEPDVRLRFLSGEARRMPSPTFFADWLVENAGNLEAFVIDRTSSRAAARNIERQTVRTCVALGHRLFNQWLVPTAQRAPRRLQDRAA